MSRHGPPGAAMEGVEARSAIAPPQYGRRLSPVWGWVGGAMPPENFLKINIKISYFSAFLQAEMVSSAVESRQD